MSDTTTPVTTVPEPSTDQPAESTCCDTATMASCCEPSAKGSCCGTGADVVIPPSSCGCS